MSESFSQKSVTNISGYFLLPSYQRGYRWGTVEVIRLLEDISKRKDLSKKYCLQPIVVKRGMSDSYELIDGQQRLTTLYIVLLTLCEYGIGTGCNYSISYETRQKSGDFLRTLSEDPAKAERMRSENIDFFYMFNAYQCAKDWIKKQNNPQEIAELLYEQLRDEVKVLWYEAGEDEDGHELFKRLNIGRIPLTNAELIKALFLNRSSLGETEDAERRQMEIAVQWDRMERELHNEAFWGFLTNATGDKYPVRLELIFDLMSSKKENERDPYFTFFHFNNRLKGGDGTQGQKTSMELWNEITDFYETLKQLHDGSSKKSINLFNRIGYLVWEGETLNKLLEEIRGKSKEETMRDLETKIKKCIELKGDEKIEDLNYVDNYPLIMRILGWFNVKTIDNSQQRFPFHLFKEGKGWSLEHINAQNSESLNTEEQWLEWLKLHLQALKAIVESEEIRGLKSDVGEVLKNRKVGKERFENLSSRVIDVLSDNGPQYDMHSISNLSLLRKDDNSALSNSVFAVKRQKIIEMDKAGKYIPVCTRNVFMKYYTPVGQSQTYFWGAKDREEYLKAIKETIGL